MGREGAAEVVVRRLLSRVVYRCLDVSCPNSGREEKSLNETVIRSHIVDAPLVALETLALALVRLLEELLLKAISSV